MIITVCWDTDGTKNTVDRNDVKVVGGGRLKLGSKIKMWWGVENKWYKGTVLQIQRGIDLKDLSTDESNGTGTSNEESQDDVPLASLLVTDNTPAAANEISFEEDLLALDDSILSEAVKNLNSSSFLDENLGGEETAIDEDIPSVETSVAKSIAIAEEHRKQLQSSSSCDSETNDDLNDPDYVPIIPTIPVPVLKELHVNGNPSQPEAFTVEGESRHPLHEDIPIEPKAKSRRLEVKESRLKGSAYVSESGANKEARNILKIRCNSTYCSRNGLGCEMVTDDRRASILSTFYGLASLSDQRMWISRHTKSRKTSTSKENSRKTRIVAYFLPIDDNGDTVRVCRHLFLNTINVTDRQVSTVLIKTSASGDVEPEKRGGRSAGQAARDARVRQLVKNHINRFPRMESHYSRANSTCEYLCNELTITKMFEMYNHDHTGDDSVTLSFYYKIFNSMNLKFSRPKKDLCGICEDFHKATEDEKQNKFTEYEVHTREKDEVRRIKKHMKDESEKDDFVGCFDLQQVILLPRSDRGELFYKRRLSNYNFTIYNLKSHKGFCYLWHEGIGKRGANEISSNLADFLKRCDREGFKHAHLFCDGCGGQNKNSVICAMLQHILSNSNNLTEVTIYYFETNHGQSEGDSVHSVIERALRRVGDIIIPSQLSVLIRMASKIPYAVFEVQTEHIKDFKALGQSLGISRARQSVGGVDIRWPDIRQLKLIKNKPKSFFFKLSHTESQFHEIHMVYRRGDSDISINQAYSKPPSIPEAKYNDLMSLCSGHHPVIQNDEQIAFFKSLAHS